MRLGLTDSKSDTLSDPAPEGFTYMGWTFVGVVSLPDYWEGSSVLEWMRSPICEARFISDSGERMGCLFGEHCLPLPIRAVMDTISRYEWQRREATLSTEYARMC